MTAVHWIRLSKAQVWHAWPHGAELSACGRIHAAQLRNSGAREIGQSIAVDDRICDTCTAKHRPPYSTAPPKDPWLELLKRDAAHRKFKLSTDNARTLARMLHTLGPPAHPGVQRDFAQIKFLLLTTRETLVKKRYINYLPNLKAALSILAEDPCYRLLCAADAVLSWTAIVQPSSRVLRAAFDPAPVLTAMFAVADPPSYIQFHHRRGLSNLSQIFHPKTLAWSQGITPGTGAEHNAALTATRAALNVITD